ncbi:MAG: glycosyltransferase family 2 protein, partial [Anaerolineae bacterium]|nr:glycosyltransferase family 2 protein [Anaerolineae bacterium]
MTSSQPDLSVVVVNWNAAPLLRSCLESVRDESASVCLEVLVVDNASSDGSVGLIEALFPEVRLIANPENLGFAAANNQAVRQASGRYILLLNPDTRLQPGALRTMVDYMDGHRAVGVLACQLLNADGSVQISCSRFPTLGTVAMDCLGLSRLFPGTRLFAGLKMTYWDHSDERDVDQPSGACLLIRREVWDEIGSLDERFFMYFEEVDFCYRAKKAGWGIRFTPAAQVIHYGGESTRQNLDVRIVGLRKSLLRFFRKHYPGWRLTVLRLLLLFEIGWRTAAAVL